MNKIPIIINPLSLLITILIILTFYSFGNFGFLNNFNIKLFTQIFILLFLIPSSIIFLFQNYKVNKIKEPLILLIFYSLLSQIILQSSSLLSNLQLIVSLICILVLFKLEFKYINLIIKSIILLCLVFSCMAILQFILLTYEPELISVMHRKFESSSYYIDLSNEHLFTKLGFIIDGGKHSLIFFDTYRFKSFSSEPSVMVYSFLAVGIMGLTYKSFLRIFAYIILIFTIILPYSGVIHLSILISIVVFFYVTIFKPSPNLGTWYLIISILVFIILIANFYNLFITMSPDWKVGSSTLRFKGISTLFFDIIKNPFINLDIPLVPPTSFMLNRGGFIPLIGILLTLFFCKKIFGFLIHLFYNNYKLYSVMSLGMILQVMLFSEYGWISLPGWIMLTLIYLRSQYLYKETKNNIIGIK